MTRDQAFDRVESLRSKSSKNVAEYNAILDQEYFAYLAAVEADTTTEMKAIAARDAEADMVAAGVDDDCGFDDYETIMGEWEHDDFDHGEYLSEVGFCFED